MAILDKDLLFREIITKAVCGKGRKYSVANHTITPTHSPSSILGCWIINHSFDAEKAGDVIEVVGTYDINVWYSYNNNTKTDVAKEMVSYVERVPLSYLDGNLVKDQVEVNASATQAPNCVEASISSNGSALVKVEREFLVEVIGETKVCVVVSPHGCSDDDKEFDLSNDDFETGDYTELDPDVIIDDLD
ncbi:outer spore coat protein CotE [Microaerobacter geothermalis]|uniref:outer spore coat protein CotE n=1 Tax=Microaerobacter geothermalis TaxID=674972 RepID=UPI001F1E6D6F|nr:outer spore coat protein CotE [Microaerobacter geothermalis]MCF6093134.1 outer spore coat protein CotE [Microaerobacter geothermalis]